MRLSKNEKLLSVVCSVFFPAFLAVTLLRGAFLSFDTNLNLWMQSIQTEPLTFVSVGIAYVFDTTILVLISVAIATYLFLKNYKAESLLLLGAMGGDALIISIAKNTIQSTRPPNPLFDASGFSFPSGHTAGTIVFCGTLAFLVWQHYKSIRVQASVGIAASAISGLVGFSRIYLIVHWFSDVLGAALIGISWLSLAILVFKVLQDKGKLQSERFQKVAAVIFCIAVVIAVLIAVLNFTCSFL